MLSDATRGRTRRTTDATNKQQQKPVGRGLSEEDDEQQTQPPDDQDDEAPADEEFEAPADEKFDGFAWTESHSQMLKDAEKEESRQRDTFGDKTPEEELAWMMNVIGLRDPLEDKIPTCKQSIDEYISRLQHSPEAFVAHFIHEESSESKIYKTFGYDQTSLGNHVFSIIMTMDRQIHRALIEGNFMHKHFSDPAFKKAVEKIEARSWQVVDQPRIYGNFFANSETGDSPTVQDLHDLAIDAQTRYLSDAKFANKVDNLMKPAIDMESSVRGVRKFLGRLSRDSCDLPMFDRVANLGTLCRAILRRCEEIPRDQWDKPIPGGLSEFGYSAKAILRMVSHAIQTGSNYLMNLFEALSKVRFGEKYMFFRKTIYHIPALELVPIAEIYCTRIGQGYIKNGGGFSHAWAGVSTNSKGDFDESQWEQFWEYSRRHSTVQESVEDYRKGMQGFVDRNSQAARRLDQQVALEEKRLHDEQAKTAALMEEARSAYEDSLEAMRVRDADAEEADAM
ncbi:unnamed protein product [Zymoseptoria tritici ST99CH_1E4]|uniref:Uncharacterized protein n=1 Tax=Zymoseptoria tritici ST99CH_1E4 TaxID=1276532 RepID=A0A2H1GZ57_ZYMTR|nr:unnamed protein product [Zymoseptoria tritici ST99CH_1E4]